MKHIRPLAMLLFIATAMLSLLSAPLSVAQNMDSLIVEFNKHKSFETVQSILSIDDYDIDLELTPEDDADKIEALVLDAYVNHLIGESRFEDAIAYGLRGAAAAERCDYEELLLEIYSTLCVSYTRIGDYVQGLKYANLTYEKDLESGNPEYISSDLNNLASICQMMNKYHEAEQYILKAISIEGQLDNRRTMAIRLGKASEIYRSLKQYDKAMSYAKEAYDIDLHDGRIGKAAIRQCQIADIQQDLGDTLAARKNYLEAIDGLKADNNLNSLSIAYYELGCIYQIRNEYAEAVKWFTQSADVARQINLNSHLVRVTEKMARLTMQRNPSESVKWFNETLALKDSIYNQNSSEQINRFNIAFETKEKEQTIEMQNAKLEFGKRRILYLSIILALLLAGMAIIGHIAGKLKIVNRELNEINGLKNKFFNIVSHDLRSPIRAQKKALLLMKENDDLLSAEDKKEMLEGLYEQTVSLEGFIENLLSWARTQVKTKDEAKKVRFDLNEAIAETIDLYKPSYKQKELSLSYDGPEEAFIVNDRNMLQAIVGNLCSNAMKFTPRGGEVRIIVRKDGSNAIIQVKDNGIGMPPEKARELFSFKEWIQKSGTEKERGTGLGLVAAYEMAIKAGGSLTVESKEGEGSTFTLTCSGLE